MNYLEMPATMKFCAAYEDQAHKYVEAEIWKNNLHFIRYRSIYEVKVRKLISSVNSICCNTTIGSYFSKTK